MFIERLKIFAELMICALALCGLWLLSGADKTLIEHLLGIMVVIAMYWSATAEFYEDSSEEEEA